MPASEPPPLRFCVRHSGRAATYACEGCDHGLCPECVDESHRLFLCPLCGERALPIADDPAITGPRVRMQAGHQRRVPLVESMRYPFRGLGGYGYWGFLVLWLPVVWLGTIQGLGWGAAVLRLILLSLIPGLILKIIRTTYDGADELPEWPDVSDLVARFGESALGLFVLLIGLTPAGLILHFAACTPAAAVSGTWEPSCHLLFFVGLVVAVLWWTAALASMTLYDSNWYALRFGLHARLLARTWPDCLLTALSISALFATSSLLHGLLAEVPLAGAVASAALGIYALMLAPHWIGLLFRRHLPAVEDLYLDDQARYGD